MRYLLSRTLFVLCVFVVAYSNNSQCPPLSIPEGFRGDDGRGHACVNGMILYSQSVNPDDSFCDVSCKPGYDGTRGSVKCVNDGVLDYGELSCEETMCSPYVLGIGVIGGDVNPCNETTLLRSNSVCSVKCEVGYRGNSTTVRCPSNASSGDNPQTTIECLENTCAPFDFPDKIGHADADPNACNEGITLFTHSEPSECTVACSPGFSGPSTLLVSCPNNAFNGQNATVQNTDACVENTCSPLTLDVELIGTDVSAYEPLPRCFDGISLGTRTNAACNVACAPGYFGSGGRYVCPADASPTASVPPQLYDASGTTLLTIVPCIEVFCNTLRLEDYPGVIGGSVNATTLPICEDGTRLTSHTTPQCVAMCAEGYFGTPATFVCPTNATPGTPLTTNIQCSENSCAPVDLGSSNDAVVVPDYASEIPCTSGIILNTHTSPTECAVTCAPGFTGSSASMELSCAPDALSGQSVNVSTAASQCIENRCAPFDFATSGATSLGSRSDACFDGIVLGTRTNSSCTVVVNTLVYTMYCAGDALEGDPLQSIAGIPQIRCAPVEGCPSLLAGESCGVSCANGYSGDPVRALCPSNATMWQAPTYVDPFSLEPSSLLCTENVCAEHILSPGVIPGDYRETNISTCVLNGNGLGGITLKTHTLSRCSLQCADGYHGNVAELRCPIDADNLDESKIWPEGAACEENRCAPIFFGTGVVGGSDPLACSDRIRLTTQTRSSCRIRCGGGYEPMEQIVVCPANASDGDPVIGSNMTCVKSVSHFSVSCDPHASGGGCTNTPTASSSSTGSFVYQTSSLMCDGTIPVNETGSVGTTVSTRGGDVIEIKGDFSQEVNPLDPGSQATYALRVGYIGRETSAAAAIGDPCTVTSQKLTCTIPSGAGSERSIELVRRYSSDGIVNAYTDTEIMQDCSLSYGRPSIDRVEGCDHFGCSRNVSGTSVDLLLTIYGSNFGESGALVFINGEECKNATHDDASKHERLVCSMPPLTQQQGTQNTMLLVQSNIFGTFENFTYARCPRGSYQIRGTGSCAPCQSGTFSESFDAFECERCPLGKFAASSSRTVCTLCEENTFAGVGASECTSCVSGRSSPEGSAICSSCSLWYLLSPGNCDVPVFGILFAAAVFVLTSLIALWIFRRYRRRIKKQKKLRRDLETQRERTELAANDIELLQKAWELSWEQVEIIRKIAEGGGGVVYEGLMQGLRVAVKTINRTKDVSTMAQSEVRWMQRARHPRLVMFLGVGRDPANNIFVVMELMTGGELLEAWIKSRESKDPMSWRERLSHLRDVVDAMIYIHRTLRSIHRDLKSENVLLALEGDRLRAKVADFGLSRIVPSTTRRHKSSNDIIAADNEEIASKTTTNDIESNASNVLGEENRSISGTMTTGTGTVAYMAPEMFRDLKKDTGNYSQAVDIFAFGVILWEAVELDRAWKDVAWTSRIIDKVLAGERLPVRSTWSASGALSRPPAGYLDLMRACWQDDPEKRPKFVRIAEALGKMQAGP